MSPQPPVASPEPDATGPDQVPGQDLADYGASMNNKDPDHLRIAFLNIRGFPYDQSSKAVQLRDFVKKSQIQVLGLSEANTNWSKIPVYARPFHLFQKWLGQSSTTVAWNRQVKFSGT